MDSGLMDREVHYLFSIWADEKIEVLMESGLSWSKTARNLTQNKKVSNNMLNSFLHILTSGT